MSSDNTHRWPVGSRIIAGLSCLPPLTETKTRPMPPRASRGNRATPSIPLSPTCFWLGWALIIETAQRSKSNGEWLNRAGAAALSFRMPEIVYVSVILSP